MQLTGKVHRNLCPMNNLSFALVLVCVNISTPPFMYFTHYWYCDEILFCSLQSIRFNKLVRIN